MLPEFPTARARFHERLRGYSLLLAAIVVGLLLALASSVYLLWSRDMQARAELARGLAGAAVALLDRGNERIARSLRGLEERLSRADPYRLADGGSLQEALDRVRQLGPLLVSVGLADADGRVIASAVTAGRTPDGSLLDPAVLAAHRAAPQGGALIGGPVQRDGTWVATLSRAVRTPDGGIAGVVYATIDAGGMVEALRPMDLRGRGRLVVMSERFTVLAHHDAQAIGRDLSAGAIAERVRAGERSGVVRIPAGDGTRLAAGFSVSPTHGVVVVFELPTPSFVGAWRDGNMPILAVIAAPIIGGILLLIILVVRLRRDAEQAERLRESTEVALRDSLESLGEGFVLWDQDDRLVLWNRRYPDLLPHLRDLLRKGMHLSEIRAESARRAFPHMSEAEIEAWLEERKRRRAQRGVPFDLNFAGDRTIEVVEHTTSTGGRVIIYRDVTIERRASRELAASESRFRDGIESIADGFILWGPDDRIVMWNRRIEELLPYARAVLRPRLGFEEYIRETVALNHASWTEAQRQQRIAERVAQHHDRNRTSEFETSDGRTIEVRESATSNGGCVSLFRDVTQQKSLLARLTAGESELQRALDVERELNAQQRRFVSMASHEFRTPLAIIDGAAQRLAALLAVADADIHRRLVRIRGAVSRMTEIIERTLATARLDDGRLEFAPAECSLARVLREVCDRQRSISPRHEIALDLDDAALTIEADARMLDQVFTNLLSNAVKYSGAAPRIEVAVEEQTDHVVVSVTDHGIGIPPDEVDRLFTRYFRASTALSIPGTGIGLHLVKELVTMHGGTVMVRSELRRGSTFIVRIPRRPVLPASRTAA